MNEVRPRYGVVLRKDGTQEMLVFHPYDDRGTYIALSAKDDTLELVLGDGDLVNVDVVPPSQSILFRRGDGGWVTTEGGRPTGPDRDPKWVMEDEDVDAGDVAPTFEELEKERLMENKEKTPGGWWKGLVTLAVVAAIIVLTVAGLNWAISL